MSTNLLTLDIGGMSCGSCVAHVRKALERLSGVRVENVRVGSADVLTEHSVTASAIRRAIVDAGYDLESVRPAGAPARDALPLASSVESTNGCCCGGGEAHRSPSSTHERHGIGRARSGQDP